MERKKHTQASLSTRLAGYIVVVVLVLVPFHAFLTVWLSSFLGHYTLLRLWDDSLLLVLVLLALGWLVRDRLLAHQWSDSLVTRLSLTYTVLTVLLGAIALKKGEVGHEALAYGLLINLRFIAWLLAVLLAAKRSDFLYRHWRGLLLAPAAVVVIFAGLQYTVLPHSFLSHFGYNAVTTIPPIETINHNAHYIRAQSTLRGANPLGAYLVIVVSALAVLYIKGYRRVLTACLGVLTLFALYASGSRSAWVGSLIAAAAAVWLSLTSIRLRRIVVITAGVLLVLCIAGVVLFRNQTGVQNALLHTQKHSAVTTTSNAAHASALHNGLDEAVRQPFGDGPGTAGQASAYNAPHPVRIAEDYYVQIAQEVGWLGLVLFVSIVVLTGLGLYRLRATSPLALTMFVSLLGISFVCLLSHAWSDDTLAFTWWGLAGIALGGRQAKEII